MTDDLSELESAYTERERSGGAQRDRDRHRKRALRREALIARSFPIAVAFGGLLVVNLAALIPHWPSITFGFGLAVVYSGLYFWGRRQVMPATVAAALVFVAMQIAAFIIPDSGVIGLSRSITGWVWAGVSVVAAFRHRHLKARPVGDRRKSQTAQYAAKE